MEGSVLVSGVQSEGLFFIKISLNIPNVGRIEEYGFGPLGETRQMPILVRRLDPWLSFFRRHMDSCKKCPSVGLCEEMTAATREAFGWAVRVGDLRDNAAWMGEHFPSCNE